MSTWTDGREDAGIPPTERSGANTIPRGCPKDHGDLVFAFESLAYECRTCDYTQEGLTPKPSDLVVARKEPAEERAYVSLPALRERWGLDDRALRRKLRNNNIAIELVRGESVVRGDLVARFDRHESYRPKEPGARSQEPGEEEEPMATDNRANYRPHLALGEPVFRSHESGQEEETLAESHHTNGNPPASQALALVAPSPIEDPDELLTVPEIAALWGTNDGATRARLVALGLARHYKEGRIAHRRSEIPDASAYDGPAASRPRKIEGRASVGTAPAPMAAAVSPAALATDPARVARLRLAIREMVARADSRLDVLPATQLEVIYALGSLALELDEVIGAPTPAVGEG